MPRRLADWSKDVGLIWFLGGQGEAHRWMRRCWVCGAMIIMPHVLAELFEAHVIGEQDGYDYHEDEKLVEISLRSRGRGYVARQAGTSRLRVR